MILPGLSVLPTEAFRKPVQNPDDNVRLTQDKGKPHNVEHKTELESKISNVNLRRNLGDS